MCRVGARRELPAATGAPNAAGATYPKLLCGRSSLYRFFGLSGAHFGAEKTDLPATGMRVCFFSRRGVLPQSDDAAAETRVTSLAAKKFPVCADLFLTGNIRLS